MVDDEEDICTLVSMILRREGVHCQCSGHLQSAIEQVKQRVYALYIVDLNLPDGTGFDLIPLIFHEDPEARVVVVTAHDDMMNRERAADMGVEAFITKPFSKRDILSLIQN